MHRAPVVPEYEVAFAPFVAVNDFGFRAMRMEIGKEPVSGESVQDALLGEAEADLVRDAMG